MALFFNEFRKNKSENSIKYFMNILYFGLFINVFILKIENNKKIKKEREKKYQTKPTS